MSGSHRRRRPGQLGHQQRLSAPDVPGAVCVTVILLVILVQIFQSLGTHTGQPAGSPHHQDHGKRRQAWRRSDKSRRSKPDNCTERTRFASCPLFFWAKAPIDTGRILSVKLNATQSKIMLFKGNEEKSTRGRYGTESPGRWKRARKRHAEHGLGAARLTGRNLRPRRVRPSHAQEYRTLCPALSEARSREVSGEARWYHEASAFRP